MPAEVFTIVLVIILIIFSSQFSWCLESPDKQFKISVPDGWKHRIIKDGNNRFYIILTSSWEGGMQVIGNEAKNFKTIEHIMEKVIVELKEEYPDYKTSNREYLKLKGMPAVKWRGVFKHEEYKEKFKTQNLLVLYKGKYYRFAAISKTENDQKKMVDIFERWIGSIEWH